MEESKVHFGIKNVHIAKMKADGETYETPFAVEGVKALNTDPEGDTINFYADDVTYYTATANQGYSGDLELAITPEEFLTQILGQIKDANNVIFESADDKVSNFALLFEANGDAKKTRFCFYNCHAERPSRENNTVAESVEVGTEKIAVSMLPRVKDGIVKSTCHEGSTPYADWFKSVYEKAAV